MLTVHGERREEQSKQSRGYEYTERNYGSFTRSVELPRNVDASRIDANYRDGVLQIHIPKSAQTQVRRVPVRSQRMEPSLQQGQQQGEQPRVMSPGNQGNNDRRDTRTQANAR